MHDLGSLIVICFFVVAGAVAIILLKKFLGLSFLLAAALRSPTIVDSRNGHCQALRESDEKITITESGYLIKPF